MKLLNLIEDLLIGGRAEGGLFFGLDAFKGKLGFFRLCLLVN